VTQFSRTVLIGSALVASLSVAQTVQALTIFSTVGGAPTGTNLLNFDDLALGTGSPQTTSTPSGSATVILTPNAQVVQGSVSGQYAAPYLSGSNGTGFGNSPVPGADTTNYLTSGSDGAVDGAAVELQFDSLMLYFGLLWGSVDAYNTLSFYNGTTLVDTVTGAQVLASPVGSQGVNGTVYVNFNTTSEFDRVIATSSQFAFEFDNVSYNASRVPDGGTTSLLLGLALTGVGVLRRKMR
jgi:hypothetical protein